MIAYILQLCSNTLSIRQKNLTMLSYTRQSNLTPMKMRGFYVQSAENQQHVCKDIVSVIHEMIHKLPTRDWLISNHEYDFVIQSTRIWYP